MKEFEVNLIESTGVSWREDTVHIKRVAASDKWEAIESAKVLLATENHTAKIARIYAWSTERLQFDPSFW